MDVNDRHAADTAATFLSHARCEVVVAEERGILGRETGFVGACVTEHREEKTVAAQQVFDADNQDGFSQQARINEAHSVEPVARIQIAFSSGC